MSHRAFHHCLPLLLLVGCGAVRPTAAPPVVAGAQDCVPAGTWVIPKTRRQLATAELLDRIASARVVLLGEAHDRPEHHAWQLETIAALNGRHDRLVLGFEAFPRRAQPVLDRWVAGELSERELLRDSDWNAVWGLPADLYLPLFQFARRNRVPMLALNVDRALVSRVAVEGWDAVPENEREGLSDPAPPSPAYASRLDETYRKHAEQGDSASSGPSGFVSAQLTWDRAFAEAIRDLLEREPSATVVGIIGSGHLEHGDGVPHQLSALGVDDVAILLPWDDDASCGDLTPDVADAVFGLEPRATAVPRPMLGVAISPAEGGGVLVLDVTEDGVGAAAGIRVGDVIVEAAGLPLAGPGDLKEIVARQAPGTWLPMKVRRTGETVELVGRFPSGT